MLRGINGYNYSKSRVFSLKDRWLHRSKQHLPRVGGLQGLSGLLVASYVGGHRLQR
jgi:hypothetical protein